MALADEFTGPVNLLVAYNDEDEVLGLLAESQAGLFGRASGGWITVTPNNRFFSGANVVNVDEDFLEFFDKLDARGNEPTLKQVNSYIVPDPSEEEVPTPEAPVEEESEPIEEEPEPETEEEE